MKWTLLLSSQSSCLNRRIRGWSSKGQNLDFSCHVIGNVHLTTGAVTPWLPLHTALLSSTAGMFVSIFIWTPEVCLQHCPAAVGQCPHAPPLMDCRSHVWCCLDEGMNASSLFSLAAWSQDREVLVQRWFIFPNGTVCCKQNFGHRVFTSCDQSPHYLRLGHQLFVIKQRLEPFEQVSTAWSPCGKEKLWGPSGQDSTGKELKLACGPWLLFF